MDDRPRILVADDDSEALELVARTLELDGAEVVRAGSGGELIERLAEGRYALIITDVSMPWMNGLEAMRSARYLGLTTPIIVITAMEDDQIATEVATLGHNAELLHKPFELSELESTVDRLLHTPS